MRAKRAKKKRENLAFVALKNQRFAAVRGGAGCVPHWIRCSVAESMHLLR